MIPAGHNTTAIIPVLGRRQLLFAAIQSVLNQTEKPAELIVVLDDYEESEAQSLNSEYRNSPCKVLFVAGPGRGPGSARNRGVTFCPRSWLAFLDSDDLWEKNRLEKICTYLQKRPHLGVCHNEERWIRQGKALHVPGHLRPACGLFLQASLQNCMISPSSLFISRQIFASTGGFDPDYPVCEDFEFFLRLLKKYPVGLVPEKLTIKQSGDWPQVSKTRNIDVYRLRALLTYLNQEDPACREEACMAALHRWKIVQQASARYGGIDLAEFAGAMNRIADLVSPKRSPAVPR